MGIRVRKISIPAITIITALFWGKIIYASYGIHVISNVPSSIEIDVDWEILNKEVSIKKYGTYILTSAKGEIFVEELSEAQAGDKIKFNYKIKDNQKIGLVVGYWYRKLFSQLYIGELESITKEYSLQPQHSFIFKLPQEAQTLDVVLKVTNDDRITIIFCDTIVL